MSDDQQKTPDADLAPANEEQPSPADAPAEAEAEVLPEPAEVPDVEADKSEPVGQPADEPAADVEPGEGLGEPAGPASADPEGPSAAPDLASTPEQPEPAEQVDQGVEAVGQPEPAADEEGADGSAATAPPEPALDSAAEQPVPAAQDQADGSSGEPVIAQAVPDTQPIFDGRPGPSPTPDTGDEELLPHPALSGHGPGFIVGATEATQAFIPVPGELSAAAVAAQAIADAGASSGTDAPPAESPALPASGTEDGSATPEPGDSADDADAAGPPPSTPAVPTAAHVPCAFGELNDDGSAALDDIDEGEAEVLRLELQGLANIALAIIKRLEKVSQKKAVGEHLEGIQTTAERVVEQALSIFTTDESDLSGFQSASADLILDDLSEGS